MNRLTLKPRLALAALALVLAGTAAVACQRAPVPSSSQAKPSAEPQEATVVASEKGFEPPTLELRAGVPARITFRRTTDKTCATEVIFPNLKIERDLPLNQPVVIELTPQKGELTFACGMDMFKGSIVVQ
jgi:plastocyanin domain-containing protein